MRYQSLKRRSRHFLAFTGLKVEEFERLAAEVREDWLSQRLKKLERPGRKRKPGGGRKPSLPELEDQLLLILLWAKVYPSYLFLEYLFGIDESTVSRVISSTKLLLQGKFVFQDPRSQKGRKQVKTLEELREILPPDIELEDILVDGTEQPIPRPERKTKRSKYHSGKKKRFTVKTQIATTKDGYILHVNGTHPGRDHDYKIFKASMLPQIIPKGSKLYGDSGYQGVQKDFPDLYSVIPAKRSKSHPELTRSEKIMNTKQRKVRVKVEHAISRLKKYQVLAQSYRHSLQNYESTFRFVANIVNFRMLQRQMAV